MVTIIKNRILNILLFIASSIYAERARNIFLFFLVVLSTCGSLIFSYIYNSYSETIRISKIVGMADSVCWLRGLEDSEVDFKVFDDSPLIDEIRFIDGGWIELYVNDGSTYLGNSVVNQFSQSFMCQDCAFLDCNMPLRLKSGRMPTKPNEAVISESSIGSYSIGDVITGTFAYDLDLVGNEVRIVDGKNVELEVVGICNSDSYVFRSGCSFNSKSLLIDFFEKIEETEKLRDTPYLYVYGSSYDKAEQDEYADTVFIYPAKGYSADDVVEYMRSIEFQGVYQTYDYMLEGYNQYFSNVIKNARVVGALAVFLLFVSIFTGVVLGIESNRYKLDICYLCGGMTRRVYLLSLISYMPSVLVGNVVGYCIFVNYSRSRLMITYRPPVEHVVVFFGIELLIFVLLYVPYLFKKELSYCE